MAVTRCASSHLMTELLAWRNPQGREEEWLGRPRRIQLMPVDTVHSFYPDSDDEDTYEVAIERRQRTVSAEIGLCLLVVTSTIETIAYSVLALVSLILHPITNRPYTFFAKLLESSSFTIIWGLADALFYNPFFVNVMTHESFARYWAKLFNPTSIPVFRLDDALYIADWQQRYGGSWNTRDGLLRPILDQGILIQTFIDQGANFIRQDVLANASAQTRNLFRDMDPSLYMFILTKAIYIYAAGPKKDQEIPRFFKPKTRDLILDFRQKFNNEVVVQGLQRLIVDPVQFEVVPADASIKSAFIRLKGIASGELQNSLLATRCWMKAVELLDVNSL